MKMYNRFIFVLVSVYLTLSDGAPTNKNQQSEQIKLFEDESDINELMGFPQGFFGVNSEGSPFLVPSGPTSNETIIADAFQTLRDELYMNDIFFHYKEYFGKAYKDTEEDERKSILQEKIEYIFEHNIETRLKNQKYAMGINQFSDMTFEEFSQKLLLSFDKVNQNNIFKKASLRESGLANEGILHSQVPQCKDWTEFDTPVKNQGICGSCWAFSTLAVIENHLKKNGYVEDIDLSEQELVDCSKSYGSKGCNGSWLHEPFNYVKDRYISYEAHYKYKPKENQCQRESWWNGKIANLYMSDFKCQLLRENQIRDTVASVGTIAAVVYVDRTFQNYKSGIYDKGDCKAEGKALHAVAISGYCEDYWIIKNSWGVGWGEKGYMKIERGQNICGIGDFKSCYPQIIEKPSQGRMKKLEDTIEDIKKNPFPIGFIYVQHPNEKNPTEIWPWMIWNEVSSAYAGVFFRVAGGEAEPFGQVQYDNSPRLTEVKSRRLEELTDQSNYVHLHISPGSSSPFLATGLASDNQGFGNKNQIGTQFTISGGEVRPRNMAIRVWKRTG